MTFYRRLCAINYPTVVLLLLVAGAWLLIAGVGLAVFRFSPFLSVPLIVSGLIVFALPSLLNPWSQS